MPGRRIEPALVTGDGEPIVVEAILIRTYLSKPHPCYVGRGEVAELKFHVDDLEVLSAPGTKIIVSEAPLDVIEITRDDNYTEVVAMEHLPMRYPPRGTLKTDESTGRWR